MPQLYKLASWRFGFFFFLFSFAEYRAVETNWESVRKNVTKSLPLRSCYVINACGADAAREEPVATSQSRLGLQPSPLAEGSKESVAIF